MSKDDIKAKNQPLVGPQPDREVGKMTSLDDRRTGPEDAASRPEPVLARSVSSHLLEALMEELIGVTCELFPAKNFLPWAYLRDLEERFDKVIGRVLQGIEAAEREIIRSSVIAVMDSQLIIFSFEPKGRWLEICGRYEYTPGDKLVRPGMHMRCHPSADALAVLVGEVINCRRV